MHKTVFTRSPNSLGGGLDNKGLVSSQKSVDSTDTIRAFFNQGGTKVQKARRVTEKEHERVRRVQRARENAMSLAVEAQARHILREKKEAKNEKRYKQYKADEGSINQARFDELKEQREEKLLSVRKGEQELDDKGHRRYGEDMRRVEESIEKAKEAERQRAVDSHLRLKSHMELKDKRREDLIQTLNMEAVEARQRLSKI